MTRHAPARVGGHVAAVQCGLDAVVIVPGIMGSELMEAATGRRLWGMGPIAANAMRFGHRDRMRALALTEEERGGRVGRVVPGGLLVAPEWASGFGGFEPYSDLVRAARKVVLHRDAVLEFGYDWRLSVDHNAPILAKAARTHLTRWRTHPELQDYRREYRDNRVPRLVFIAHSMGGLLVRAALGVMEMEPSDSRAVVTLGTPFAGAIGALELLANGRNPLHQPATATRDASRTMPGVYDLLPGYRCRVVGGEENVVALVPEDIAAVGGDLGLAKDAFERRTRPGSAGLPGHVAVVGVAQPTPVSVEISDGTVLTHRFGFRRDNHDRLLRGRDGRLLREDHRGDGTVFRYAARLPGAAETPLAQQHEALAKTSSALDLVRAVLTGTDELGSVLGQDDIGIDVPEFALLGQPLPIRISGQFDPARITCAVEDARTSDTVLVPVVRGRPDSENMLLVEVMLPGPGMFRVLVAAGNDPVTTLVLAGTADDLDG